mmetsp:Transcript_28921/g.94172  ORF Transcript_28921/g.94172 Transcript_28921/m.94172 type:complete len:276 (+) Transcript_28921:716-1543(+)
MPSRERRTPAGKEGLVLNGERPLTELMPWLTRWQVRWLAVMLFSSIKSSTVHARFWLLTLSSASITALHRSTGGTWPAAVMRSSISAASSEVLFLRDNAATPMRQTDAHSADATAAAAVCWKARSTRTTSAVAPSDANACTRRRVSGSNSAIDKSDRAAASYCSASHLARAGACGGLAFRGDSISNEKPSSRNSCSVRNARTSSVGRICRSNDVDLLTPPLARAATGSARRSASAGASVRRCRLRAALEPEPRPRRSQIALSRPSRTVTTPAMPT